MNLPLVSVVVPVYNCEACVAEAVRSALEQDHPNIEVIVVDDGSRDRTVETLLAFGDRIRLHRMPNGGPARARNAGMALARGIYIAFLDADDVWLPGKLSAQVKHLEAHPEVGICYTGWHVWHPGPDGRFVRPSFADLTVGKPAVDAIRSGWIFSRLLFDCELLTSTVMMRAETARRAGPFEPTLMVGEDYDLWLRMAHAAKITRLDCIATLYRMLPNSASHSARANNFEYDVVRLNVERFGLRQPEGEPVPQSRLEARLDELVFQHAYLHLTRGDARIALQSFLRLLRRHPWRVKLWALAARAALLVPTAGHVASMR